MFAHCQRWYWHHTICRKSGSRPPVMTWSSSVRAIDLKCWKCVIVVKLSSGIGTHKMHLMYMYFEKKNWSNITLSSLISIKVNVYCSCTWIWLRLLWNKVSNIIQIAFSIPCFWMWHVISYKFHGNQQFSTAKEMIKFWGRDNQYITKNDRLRKKHKCDKNRHSIYFLFSRTRRMDWWQLQYILLW